MNYIYGKFNEKIENVYLTKFSSWRYKFFQFLEKVYKKLISNKDGRVEFIRNYISKTQPQMILEIGSGTLTIYPFLKKTIQRKFDYYISEINPVKVNYLKKKYPHLKIICANALSLPYRNDYFDFVFSKGVFHHIDDNDYKKRKEKK